MWNSVLRVSFYALSSLYSIGSIGIVVYRSICDLLLLLLLGLGKLRGA